MSARASSGSDKARVGRRDVLRALAAVSLIACGAKPVAPTPAPEVPLPLAPLGDLVHAAGLGWVLVVEPRSLTPILPHIYKLVPEQRFALFATRHGGVDLRELDEVVVASYAQGALALARGTIDPAKVEAAFVARAVRTDARVVDRVAGPETTIVRVSGEVGATKEQLVVFGRHGAGLEIGGDGRHSPLRVAELFLEGRLKRASPAFRSPPLDLCATALGPAPARLFFPGPFTGDVAKGLAGLLQAATAVGIATTLTPSRTLAVRVVVMGVSGTDPVAAEQRLVAAYDTMATSGIGRLCGLDHPKRPPTATHTDSGLALEVELDPAPIAIGLYDATQASLPEMFRL